MIAAGTTVRVRDAWPEQEGPVHVRTPHYLRGCRGTVVRALGAFPNPEDLAFRRPAPTLPLYHVEFSAAAVWRIPPEDARPEDAQPESARPGDTLLVEIYAHWLEEAP